MNGRKNQKSYIIIGAVAVLFAVGVAWFAMAGEGNGNASASSNTKTNAETNAQNAAPNGATESGLRVTGTEDSAWLKRCNEESAESQSNEAQCEIYQTVTMGETGKRLVEVAFSPRGENTRVAIIMPLGIRVDSGLALTVDEGEGFPVPVRTCNRNGCVAFADAPQETLDAIKGGEIMDVLFVDGARKKVRIQLSLKGFAKAYDSI